MTWLPRADGYEVFFNRDELRTRRPATPPSELARAGVRYLAPLDGESGGTWIAANEHGITLCLLNGYQARDGGPPAPGVEYTSRGLLVAALADCAAPEEAGRRLRARDLREFRSFLLAVLAPGQPALLSRWSAGRLESCPLGPEDMPLVSSSFDTDSVRRARVELFRHRSPADAAGHLDYHRSHVPDAGPYSVCMHRPDAQTVSFSHVVVGRRDVRFGYVSHPPHEGLPAAAPLTLARSR